MFIIRNSILGEYNLNLSSLEFVSLIIAVAIDCPFNVNMFYGLLYRFSKTVVSRVVWLGLFGQGGRRLCSVVPISLSLPHADWWDMRRLMPHGGGLEQG